MQRWSFQWFADRYAAETVPVTSFYAIGDDTAAHTFARAGAEVFGGSRGVCGSVCGSVCGASCSGPSGDAPDAPDAPDATGDDADARDTGLDVLALREDQDFLYSHPELLDMIDCPRGTEAFLWLAPAGAVTGLHADMVDRNELVHVWGRKRVVFYAPEAAPLLYAVSREAEDDGVYAEVDPLAPDLARFPRFAAARVAFDFELAPGDVLTVPRGWFHYVEYVTDGISVGCVS